MAQASDRARMARLAAQHAVARVLAESATLAEATPRLVQAIGETLGWPVGSVWTVDEEAGVLRYVSGWAMPGSPWRAFDASNRELTFPPGRGLPGRVWASAEPAWIADVTRDAGFTRTELAVGLGLRAGFAFPIEDAGHVLGVIELLAPEVRTETPEVLDLAAIFGSQIGRYVERRRTEERLLASEALQSAILDATLDAVVTIDHKGCVIEFNPAAERIFGYPRENVVGRELAELIVPPALRDRHRDGLAHVVATGEGPILDTRLELPGLHARGHEIPVELTVTRIGSGEPPTFTGFLRDITERRRAEEERARLLEAERSARRRAEQAERRSSAIARTLQQSLLPPHLPCIPGIELASRFRAAGEGNEVGGDFYDLFETTGGAWAVAIGDVVGKGAPAAALTALARYTLRAAAVEARGPKRILRLLSDAILRQRSDGEFCTATFAALTPAAGGARLTCASAGHPLPLLRRAAGGVRDVGEPGTLLGVFPDPTLAEAEVALAPGDVVLLYTDGITELRTPDGLLGRDRLAAVLDDVGDQGAEAIAASIEARTLDGSANEVRDDIALLVLRAAPAPSA